MAICTSSPLRVTSTFASIFRRVRGKLLSDTSARKMFSHAFAFIAPTKLCIFRLLLGVPVLLFPRQSYRTFMRALAEGAFHSGCQADRGLSKFVAQMVGCCLHFLPALIPCRFQQVKLCWPLPEIRRLYSQ